MRWGWALAAVFGVALLLRAVGFEEVFVGDGEVVFVIGDPYYHLRRALFTWTRFPETLRFDSYLNFPAGAYSPWPPPYDFVVAALARTLGDSPRQLALVSAWLPPLCSAATVFPVYAATRAVAGPGTGLAAAAIFAGLPAALIYSRIGYADHHAAVALLGTTLLALQMGALGLRDASRLPARLALVLGLAAVRAALVVLWAGSLTYLAVAEGALVLCAATLGRRTPLAVEAASLVVSALLVAPFAARAATPVGGPFSAIELSWLHVALCVAAALWALACRTPRSASTPRRLGGALALGALLVLSLLALPAIREGLASSFGFMGKTDIWGPANPEQASPLSGLGGRRFLEAMLGRSVYLLPLAPFAGWALARRVARPEAGFLLLAWACVFGALALVQVRFLSELAPFAAGVFAVLLGTGGAWLAGRLGRGGAAGALLAIAAGLALLGPAFWGEHAGRAAASLAALRGGRETPAQLGPAHSVVRFAEQVRVATPETAGFLDPAARPEYGLLCDPTLGHTFLYASRRPTVSGNFGPYVGRENLEATLRVVLAADEEEALRTLEQLGVRYVVTNWLEIPARSLFRRLHRHDGRESGRAPPLRHFRLVAEGPPRGSPLPPPLGPSRPPPVAPYKLFEVVRGAVLEVHAAPGEVASARARITTPGGRSFHYRARGVADADGRVRIRVPYPTRQTAGVRPAGPWRIDVAGAERFAEVTERDVREGRVVPVAE